MNRPATIFLMAVAFLAGAQCRLVPGRAAETRARLPRTFYFVPLTSALVIGALLPTIQNAQRQSLETETIPGLLRQIHDAERVYSARQPNGIFAWHSKTRKKLT